jgi:hypothetical protein
MAKNTGPGRVICRWCGARYTVQASWLDSAVEFSCRCGADLKADMDDLFQIRHDITDRSEITLHPDNE